MTIQLNRGCQWTHLLKVFLVTSHEWKDHHRYKSLRGTNPIDYDILNVYIDMVLRKGRAEFTVNTETKARIHNVVILTRHTQGFILPNKTTAFKNGTMRLYTSNSFVEHLDSRFYMAPFLVNTKKRTPPPPKSKP